MVMKTLKSRKIKLKVKKGDEVVIISGSDKGKKGSVKFVLPKIGSVLIDGINTYKRAVKPEHNNNQNFLTREKPIKVSKIKLLNVVKSGKKRA